MSEKRTVKLRDIVDAAQPLGDKEPSALDELAQHKKLAAAIRNESARLTRFCKRELEVYYETRMDLLEKYGEKVTLTIEGRKEPREVYDVPQCNPEKRKGWRDELKQLLDSEIELNGLKPIELPPECDFSVGALAVLLPFGVTQKE